MKTPLLSEVEEMARSAGDILRRAYGEQIKIDHKGPIDLVTDVDYRSEALLVESIRAHYPDHQIFAEERGQVAGNGCSTWFIDPLDGTINFAHNIPIFAVSLGYEEDNQLKLGVVYDPMRDECFSAELGKGAWLNGKPLRVSKTRELIDGLLVTGFPYDIRTNPETNLDYHARFAVRSQGVRRLGSAALDLCYVAAGRFDGYWETFVERWDIAAGLVIAGEAGTRITDLHGGDGYFQPPCSVLAANPVLHGRMLEVLNGKAARDS